MENSRLYAARPTEVCCHRSSGAEAGSGTADRWRQLSICHRQLSFPPFELRGTDFVGPLAVFLPHARNGQLLLHFSKEVSSSFLSKLTLKTLCLLKFSHVKEFQNKIFFSLSEFPVSSATVATGCPLFYHTAHDAVTTILVHRSCSAKETFLWTSGHCLHPSNWSNTTAGSRILNRPMRIVQSSTL